MSNVCDASEGRQALRAGECLALIQEYCVGCHEGGRPSGGLDLSKVKLDDKSLLSLRATWERVVRKLQVQQMPPIGEARPSAGQYAAMIQLLTARLDRLAVAHPSPGRPPSMRRLTRNEYQNVIRDLLSVEIDASRWLPADDASHGFDNVTVSGLSPTLMLRHVSAAQHISRIAMGGQSTSPGGRTFRLSGDLTQERQMPGLPPGSRGGGVFRYTFPRSGEYEVTVRLARDRNELVEGLHGEHTMVVLLDRKPTRQFKVRPPADRDHSLVDAHLRARINVDAGAHDVVVTFLKHSAPVLSTLRQPYDARYNYHRHPRTMPAVYQVSITGPYGDSRKAETASRQRLLTCTPNSESGAKGENECAEEILRTVMRRAYRRPIRREDLSQPMRFFREGRDADGFETGIELALSAVLVNPNFLFRIEPDGSSPDDSEGAAPRKLSSLELASRLSFFLWSSIPDEELLTAGTDGTLANPAVMGRQVTRMLQDVRADALVRNFASQWLYLRNLTTLTPDLRLFPDFDDNLRQAFRRETELFFASIIQEDRSVLDLLTADYTYLNQRLAKHYRVKGVYGSHFRRVERPTSSIGPRRGGLLRHGSILTVTSYATRTSPVLRGNWILENIVGAPPPPPPPNVPALKEKAVDSQLSLRERLAQHREDDACSACHNLMDPVGFALESYDAVGRWRTMESGKPIETRGELSDGTTFDGVAELERSLVARPDWFAACLAEKLLTYAVGRGIEPADGPVVRSIVRAAEKDDYRFSALVRAIVASDAFLMRGVDPSVVAQVPEE